MIILIVIATISLQTTLISCGIFRNTIHDIHDLSEEDQKCSDDPCPDFCIVKEMKLFDASSKTVDLTKFHSYHRPIAKKCFKKLANNCETATKFIQCFLDATEKQGDDDFEKCDTKYPIDLDPEAEFTEKVLKEVKNAACYLACTVNSPRIFNDKDEFVKDALRTNSNIPFKTLDEAKKCYKKHQQKDQCQRRANRYVCLDEKYNEEWEKFEEEEIDYSKPQVYN